jgi:hypothetical protein
MQQHEESCLDDMMRILDLMKLVLEGMQVDWDDRIARGFGQS